MDCQKCGQKSANIHIVRELNGQQHEFFLCSDCAKKDGNYGVGFSLGLDNGLHFALHNFLPGFIGHTKNVVSSIPKEFVCEECGLTFGEFQNLGRLGCGSCYVAFRKQLAPIISRIHGNVEYRGKKPAEKMEVRSETERFLDALKKELQEAVSKEEYERAAKIRDQIKNMHTIRDDGKEGVSDEPGV
jgi:protein arginine kinase activator